MIVNMNELIKGLINKKLLIFKSYQVDVKKIKWPLQWCEKNESIFLIMGFLSHQII
jgi:hypothetical protein